MKVSLAVIHRALFIDFRHASACAADIRGRWPYAASSFLSVAIANAFGTALSGRSKDRPELVSVPMPLEIHIAALACRGGETILRRSVCVLPR